MAIQQKNKPENLEDHQARIERLAGFNKTALEAMTMSNLRELGAFLVPHARKLKKAEYIDALLEISEPYRIQRVKEALLTIELSGEFQVTSEFIKHCQVQGLKPSDCTDIITTRLEAGNYTPSTIAKTKMKQLRAVLDAVSFENVEIKPWSDDVYKLVSSWAGKYHRETNLDYAETVENYGTEENLIRLDGKKILNWATEIIDWAYAQPDLNKGWHKVSFALALTSGRRMDEIHGDCKFEVVNDQTLRSIGLSKKREDDAELESPCLVDANKWVAVINKLPDNRRNQPNAIVNGTIRKAISESISNVFTKLDFHKFDEQGNRILGSYKDSRDFYVSYLIARDYNKSKHGSEINFAKKTLGHESKKQTMSYLKMVVEL
jgi:hypothetical protein